MASFKSCTSVVLFLALLSLASASYTYEPTPKAYTYYPKRQNYCPRDVLKFGVCANVLDAIFFRQGVLPTGYRQTYYRPAGSRPCCSLIQGLVDFEAAVCLCTALKANVLGVKVNVEVEIELLLNYCGYQYPNGYQCR